jgi:hypothetical protein
MLVTPERIFCHQRARQRRLTTWRRTRRSVKCEHGRGSRGLSLVTAAGSPPTFGLPGNDERVPYRGGPERPRPRCRLSSFLRHTSGSRDSSSRSRTWPPASPRSSCVALSLQGYSLGPGKRGPGLGRYAPRNRFRSRAGARREGQAPRWPQTDKVPCPTPLKWGSSSKPCARASSSSVASPRPRMRGAS